MPGRVQDPVSTQPELVCSADEVNSSQPVSTTTSPPPRDENQVTAWSGEAPTPTHDVAHEGEQLSPAQLQARAAKEAAAINLLDAGLRRLEERVPNMTRGDDAERKSAALATTAVLGSAQFMAAVRQLPRETVQAEVSLLVRETATNVSPERQQVLVERMMGHLDEGLRTDAAQRMKDVAVAQLKTAATQFHDAAGDLIQREGLVASLKRLEAPGATAAQQDQAVLLRSGLGLPAEGAVTTQSLGVALDARAKLMREEADKLTGAGDNTLYRALLTQDVSAQWAKQAGIEPGSYSARQLATVRERGESDERQLTGAKLTATVAMGLVTAGTVTAMGLGVSSAAALGGAGAASMNVAAVGTAWHEVDAARAGASAGTAAADAELAALHNAKVKTAEAVVEVGAGAAFAASKAVSVAHEVALVEAGGAAHHAGVAAEVLHAGEHFLKELGVEGAITVGAHAVEQSPTQASGRSALDRASP
jgi:hypothetical protein